MPSQKSSKKSIPAIEETRRYPYLISDLCVAAYLRMKNYKVESVMRGEGEDRAMFCFMCATPEERDELKRHVRDYHNDVGGFRLFSDIWRDTKGMTKTMR